MNTEATLEQLRELKLHGMARGYQAVLSLPVNSQPEAHELLAQLVQQELENKCFKRTEMHLCLKK